MRRAIAALTLLGFAVALEPVPALAQTGPPETDVSSAWSKFMRAFGVQKAPDSSTSDIDYTERAPLVVPPTRDLPPPAASMVEPVNWPKDPAKHAKSAKGKPALVPNTAVQTPNPPHEKKPWYNPAGWFDKEEYANFAGEPARQELTDPPTGYRVPSPDQPYGIAPDKKSYSPSGKDMMLGKIDGGSGQGGQSGQSGK